VPGSLRKIDLSAARDDERTELLDRQWLVTNGLGGFASGILGGHGTWRYHGLLIAALPAPLGRMMMLNELDACLRRADGRAWCLGGNLTAGEELPLREFRVENQIPHWRYGADSFAVEKTILMPNLQNTVHLTFRIERPEPGLRLELRPALQFRPFENAAGVPPENGYEVRCHGRRIEVRGDRDIPPLRLHVVAPTAFFVAEEGTFREVLYTRDAERGYEARGQLWSPGYFSVPLDHVGTVTLVASTEDWRTLLALAPDDARALEESRIARLLRPVTRRSSSAVVHNLAVAADQFIIAPKGRFMDLARARAEGNELRSVIAGYHWFTDWGRDTMISLEGLTLATGRFQEASWILHTFARAVRDGLIPNLFPEGQNQGLYHTADATLWFFHAVHRYVSVTQDRDTLAALLPVLQDIAAHHFAGTRFGIGVAEDGLLSQGQEGYQLTWMDAKVGDWVVTPRRGKAVEINALWYNALRVLEKFLRESGDVAAAEKMNGAAQRAAAAFNQRFWNASTGCLFDVVDGPAGDDPAVRPNQLFAISLPFPVLAPERWPSVLGVVEKELLTPVGLRTLSPRHPDYKAKYSGDLRARDAAYHQGTVWPWLIGPFVDAWLKVHPGQNARASRFLDALLTHLDSAGVGSISEIFDAEPPYAPRGCIAQAWSVAEILRVMLLAEPAADQDRGHRGGSALH
jgi:predicted glycogen debranching enzyme